MKMLILISFAIILNPQNGIVGYRKYRVKGREIMVY